MPEFLIWREVAIPLAACATVLLLGLSVVKAISRGFERRHQERMASHGGDGDVENLRADLGQLRSHVEALEERLDFTERLLTQERQRRQLEPGA